MKTDRIFAIVLRNLYTFRRNIERVFDAFYGPIISLIIWGLTSVYISKISENLTPILFFIVSGLSFWLLVERSQYETNVALLEDIWSRNISNIFISPLKFWEWIIGVTIIGIFKSIMSFVTAFIVAFILYKINFFMYGFYLIPFILLLLMTGWWISFLITGAILRYGTRVQSFAWNLAFILVPFSGVYYPISSLPEWAQKISVILPTTYVFDGIRQVVLYHTLDIRNLFISFLLNMLYITLSLLFIKRSYDKMIKLGMLQLV